MQIFLLLLASCLPALTGIEPQQVTQIHNNDSYQEVVKPNEDSPRTVHGKGKKTNGVYINGAAVTLFTYPGNVQVDVDLTDSNGDFSFESVDPGNYYLEAVKSGYVTARVYFTVVSGEGAQEQDVVMEEE